MRWISQLLWECKRILAFKLMSIDFNLRWKQNIKLKD